MKKSPLRFVLLLVLVCVTVVPTTAAQPADVREPRDGPAVRAVLFVSPTCGFCHHVMTEVLSPMAEQYGTQLQILVLDVTHPDGQGLYRATVEKYQISTERQGVPTLVVGDLVLVGGGEIPERFPTLVKEGLAAGGLDWPGIPGLTETILAEGRAEPSPSPTCQATDTPIPTTTPVPTPVPTAIAEANPSQRTTSDNPLPVYLTYFSDPTCLECAQVTVELKRLQSQYPNLVVDEFNLRQEAALNEELCERYGVPDEQRLMAPIVFIGPRFLALREITPARLRALIEDPAAAGPAPPWKGLEADQATATERIVERFQRFGVLAVMGAGLLDGVNPCAFTTIIFFVSYLALVGRKGREILLVGAAFSLAVFLTYLAMGLGLSEMVRRVGSFALIGRILYGATAIVCLTLAGLSLWDYAKIRRGQLTDIALQLPKTLKLRIHKTIRSSSRTARGYVGAAFGAGVLVSVFELACTGQVYLPTIVFVTGVTSLRLTAIMYLVLYNLMFVAPLVAVFAFTYLGISSRQLTGTFQSNAGVVKLLTAVLFGVLGVWLGYMVLTT